MSIGVNVAIVSKVNTKQNMSQGTGLLVRERLIFLIAMF